MEHKLQHPAGIWASYPWPQGLLKACEQQELLAGSLSPPVAKEGKEEEDDVFLKCLVYFQLLVKPWFFITPGKSKMHSFHLKPSFPSSSFQALASSTQCFLITCLSLLLGSAITCKGLHLCSTLQWYLSWDKNELCAVKTKRLYTQISLSLLFLQ